MRHNRNSPPYKPGNFFEETRGNEPASSTFGSSGGREQKGFRSNGDRYNERNSSYSNRNPYEDHRSQYGDEPSKDHQSYFNPSSKDDHQRKNPQAHERPSFEQQNFRGEYRDVDSSMNGGLSNRYNLAKDFGKRNNIREDPIRGNGRDMPSWNSSKNQNSYSNDENDRSTGYEFSQASSPYRSYSTTNQENSFGERSSRSVPARGMYAAGRSSLRPDNNEKQNGSPFGKREDSISSHDDNFRTYRGNERDYNDTRSARPNSDQNHSGYDASYSNRSWKISDDKPSRPTRGGYNGERQSFDNNSYNGHSTNDYNSSRRNYDGNNSGRRGGHNESRGYNSFGDNRDANEDRFEGKRDNFSKNNRFSESGNNYGDDDDFGNSNRGGSRGSFRGGRGRGRSFNSDFGSSFDSRGPRTDAFSENPATDQARAPRGWVPEDRDVEKDFEEDRNKEKYSEFDMDEKFKTTGGKDIQYKTWDQTGLHATLLTNLIEKSHFKKLRPIQGRVIPHVLAKKNLLGHSQTGSGKTLAYVLPILHHLLNSESFQEKIFYNPKVLVLVPTRELAIQVSNEFRKFASGTNINVGRAFGQYSRSQNRADIAQCHVIVGTIGRLKDFLSSDLDVKNLSHIVLDEADKILKDTDRAFRDMISTDKFKRIIPRCQVLMFTATLPEAFNNLTDDLLGRDYVTITNEERLKANNHVEQIYIYTESRKEKHEELRKIIENYSNVKILIFVKTKDMADILSASFEQEGIKVESLHGGRPQDLRSKIFNNFKAGGTQIVIGTDVCGRGWDVDGLDIVVNFDMPSAKESLNDCLDTFIHRIGRTGRMRTGKAITFIGDEDKDFVPHLIKLCQASQQEVPEFMLEMEKSFVEAGISRTFGQPSFGRTEFGQQSNTNAWDLTTTSAEDTEVSASAAPNSSIPSSGDPWASSSGWGESTQNDEPTIEDNDANVNEEGTTNVKANVQSDDEDENLLPSDSKEDGGGDY